MSAARASKVPSQHLLPGFIQNLAEACILLDSRGIVAGFNPVYEQLAGSEAQSIVGRPWSEVFVGPAGQTLGPNLGQPVVLGRLELATGAMDAAASRSLWALEDGSQGSLVVLRAEGGRGLLEAALEEHRTLLSFGGGREELLRGILRGAMRIAGSPRGRLIWLKEGPQPRLLRAWDDPAAPGGWRWQSGDPDSGAGAGEEPAQGAALALPLRSGESVFGVLQLESRAAQGREGDHEQRLRLLRLFGAAASSLLQSLSSSHELERENELLKQVTQSVHLLLVVGNAPEEVASLALQEALRLSGCLSGLFLMRHPDSGVFEAKASQGFEPARLQAYLDAPLAEADSHLLLRLLAGGQAVSPSDLAGCGALAGLFPRERRRFFCVPIAEGPRLSGILLLGGGEGSDSAPLVETFIRLFAEQAGLAMRNSLLFGQLRQKKRDFERAAEILIHSEKLAMAGKMAAAVAHQVRNPLSVIGANVQLMLAEMVAGDPRVPELEIIVRKVSEADAAIRELMELAKPLVLRPELRELGHSLSDIERFIRSRCRSQGVEIKVALAGPLPKVWVDELQFQRCLLDLCLNALQELKAGGHLLLAAAHFGARVEVRVEDDGPGIAPEALPRVFEPFFTTRPKGHGLGLYNVRRISEAMGVSVQAGNREGGGACFRFSFPVTAERPAAILPSIPGMLAEPEE